MGGKQKGHGGMTQDIVERFAVARSERVSIYTGMIFWFLFGVYEKNK
jgi:hypothetical protein